MQTFREWLRESELNEGKLNRDDGSPIMKSKYSGKLSEVIPKLRNSYIFLGTKNGTQNIAIIGGVGGPSSEFDGLKQYDIKPGQPFKHYIYTGNAYKASNMEIKLYDSIKINNSSKPNKEYKDETYEYYEFD